MTATVSSLEPDCAWDSGAACPVRRVALLPGRRK
jgi:hypothetical protein